ncbi:MAG: hypothetical protein RJB10_920, partial [Pseudomonadota bacterium]
TAARCVIHTHSTHCVALTLRTATHELLPALTPYFVMKVGHVPLINYHRPGDPQAAEAVAAVILAYQAEAVAAVILAYQARGIPIRAVMLDRLGPNVWHDSPAATMATLEELEETAKLWHLIQGSSQGSASSLSESNIAELRQTFGAFW